MQVEWSIDVDPHIGCHSRGVMRKVNQPWPLDPRIIQVRETHRTEADAIERLLELARDGKDIYLNPDPEYFGDQDD